MSIREKLKAVKSSVTIVDLLRKHGIQVPSNTETQIRCPFHGPDNKPSARVYATTNTLFCWTCHKLWDVVAAEMYFANCTLVEAVDSLADEYSVDVQAQPQEIVRFYGQAVKYQRGDTKYATVLVSDIADRFRRYYTAIPDWGLLDHIIDYFWQEYDEMTNNTGDALPVDLIDAALAWYSRAHSMVAMQLPTISVIHPEIGIELEMETEEI